MNKVILVGKEGKTSMSGVFSAIEAVGSQMIVKGLNKKRNENSFKLYTEKDVENFTRLRSLDLRDSIMIRYGTRFQIPEETLIVYNTNRAINNSSNKYTARKLFASAGVNIPKLVTIDNFEMEDLPIIARPFQHKQGKDFVVIKDYGNFREFYQRNSGSWYFSAYIEKDAEYRVHCAHGRILSIMKKPKPEDPTVMAWNHAQVEEAFDAVPWSDWDMDICKTALKACKALELDFCGLDIIVQDGVPYVLEANTCPSLSTSPYNTNKYAQYFNWLFMVNSKRPHWDFEDKKETKSLAWKSWMFEDRDPKKKAKKTN